MSDVSDIISELSNRIVDLERDAGALATENERLREALEMVRDADNDCRLDGLQTIPPAARAKIDAALSGKGES